jgi:hypothetical protein
MRISPAGEQQSTKRQERDDCGTGSNKKKKDLAYDLSVTPYFLAICEDATVGEHARRYELTKSRPGDIIYGADKDIDVGKVLNDERRSLLDIV